MFLLLLISMVVAAATVPFGDTVIVIGTSFWLSNDDEVWMHLCTLYCVAFACIVSCRVKLFLSTDFIFGQRTVC